MISRIIDRSDVGRLAAVLEKGKGVSYAIGDAEGLALGSALHLAEDIKKESVGTLAEALRRRHGNGATGIIFKADTMSPGAAASLLKLLEEPPEGVSLVLAVSSYRSLLPTIRSRCAYEAGTVPPAGTGAAQGLLRRLETASRAEGDEGWKDLVAACAGDPAAATAALEAAAWRVYRLPNLMYYVAAGYRLDV